MFPIAINIREYKLPRRAKWHSLDGKPGSHSISSPCVPIFLRGQGEWRAGFQLWLFLCTLLYHKWRLDGPVSSHWPTQVKCLCRPLCNSFIAKGRIHRCLLQSQVVVGFQRWCKERCLDRLSRKVGQCFPFYNAWWTGDWHMPLLRCLSAGAVNQHSYAARSDFK